MGKYNSGIHHRRSIRLKNYDYAQTGAYFVTVVTHERTNRFGKIENGKIILNDAGKMVAATWVSTMNEYNGFSSHCFIVMPNHFHGIINIVGADSISGPILRRIK